MEMYLKRLADKKPNQSVRFLTGEGQVTVPEKAEDRNRCRSSTQSNSVVSKLKHRPGNLLEEMKRKRKFRKQLSNGIQTNDMVIGFGPVII